MTDLVCGQVVWINFNPVVGSEQSGHRPAIIVSSDDYLDAIPNVAIVVPVTTRDRQLPNHVRLRGDIELEQPSFAMTEQPRTVDRRRITGTLGNLDSVSLTEIRRCLARFLSLD